MADYTINIDAAPVRVIVSGAQGPASGGSADFANNKASIANGDKFCILDSAASDAPKHSLWSLVKSTLKTYFDTLYVTLAGAQTITGDKTFTGAITAPRITGKCEGLEMLCKAGLSISAGQVVYVTGASGNNIVIGLARANAEATSSKTIGISESTLANNATGYVITEGLMTVNISAPTAAEGDPIWLSPTTAGSMVFGVSNKPSAPNHIVYLGVVTRKTGNDVVEISVKVQNGSELDELADVAITSPVAGHALIRGASFWENRSLTSADVGLTTKAQFQAAMTDDDFVTLAGAQTITGAKTFPSTIKLSSLTLDGGSLTEPRTVAFPDLPGEVWLRQSFTPTGSNLALAVDAADARAVLEIGDLAIVTPGTGVATALAANIGSAGATVLFDGAGGTPSSITLTNATGLPIVAGTIGTLSVARGGTGATSAAAAWTGLGGSGTITSPTFVGISLNSGTLTTSTPLAFTQTWNNAATTFTGFQTNITDTASNASSLLMDLQVGGISQFKVSKTGNVSVNNLASISDVCDFNANGGIVGRFQKFVGFFATNNNTLGISSNLAAPDVVLARDAANTLAQRNGTNSQTSRLYNTFTARGAGTTNLEALETKSQAAGSFIIQSLKGSAGGTARDIELRHGGTDTNGTITNGTAVAKVTSQGLALLPLASSTPATNGDLTFEATSNTSITVKYRGTDGIVRSAVLLLT